MEKKETYGWGQIIAENLLILAHIALGAWAMAGIPFLSIVYVAFLLFMLLYFLRKHLCTHCCYYGTLCHSGWGKLALPYKKGSGNLKIATPAAGITWIVLMGLPVLVSIGFCLFDFSTLRIIQLALLIVFAVIQAFIHKTDCKTCKHRDDCTAAM
jgi:hypothetical protein